MIDSSNTLPSLRSTNYFILSRVLYSKKSLLTKIIEYRSVERSIYQ